MNDDTRRFVRAHREDDVRDLALRRAPDGVDLVAALQQIAGWQIARRKLPLWAKTEGIVYPVRLSMEQCSSQAAAEYKRRVIQEICPATRAFADLTGGLGVDFSFMAPLFSSASYVERSTELCDIACHNLPVLGGGYTLNINNCSAEEILDNLPHQDVIYLDPARRDAVGRKVFLTADCQPDVVQMHDRLLEKADVVMIKLSPMLDIHDALRSLPATRQVHVVEVDGEVKELLLVLGEGGGHPQIVCTDTKTRFVFTHDEEVNADVFFADSVEAYLYEPAPSIMKAGAFRTVAARYGLGKLHRDSHLYTSDCLVDDFPGRKLRAEAVFTMREARRLPVSRANIVCRNFPLRPEELRKKLKLKDGGEHFLYATTTITNAHILILCSLA